MSGSPTHCTKRSVILCGHGMRRARTCDGTGSAFRLFYFAATCASRANPGAHATAGGSATDSSVTLLSRLRSKLTSTLSSTTKRANWRSRDRFRELLATSPWAMQMQALQALKGVGPVVAATIIAEVGDFSRFTHPRQLVAYFGLAPGEHCSGGVSRPRGITKAGSSLARTVLCEAAWNYRTTPKVGQWMKERCPPVPYDIKALAWKAQLRLHKTYRRLTAKRSVVATAAVARELL